jgi:hypothetical protein
VECVPAKSRTRTQTRTRTHINTREACTHLDEPPRDCRGERERDSMLPDANCQRWYYLNATNGCLACKSRATVWHMQVHVSSLRCRRTPTSW